MLAYKLAKILLKLPKNVSVFVNSSFDDCFTPSVYYEKTNKVVVIKTEQNDKKRKHWSTDYSDGKKYVKLE
jgi:hypothetical protein